MADVAIVAGAAAIDPVCGMFVMLKPGSRTKTYGAQLYQFLFKKVSGEIQGRPAVPCQRQGQTIGYDVVAGRRCCVTHARGMTSPFYLGPKPTQTILAMPMAKKRFISARRIWISAVWRPNPD